jgi:dipeptidyl aminopeptidase/acylaminoacyl peptidase
MPRLFSRLLAILQTLALSGALLVLRVEGQPAFSQELPPLVDRELFFGDPEIDSAQISPEGDYIAFLKPWHGVQNIWVKKTNESFSSAKLLTAETKWPIYGFFWSQDGKYVLYQQDHDGDGHHNLFAVNPSASTERGSDAPTSRDLSQVRSGRVIVYVNPRNDPDFFYIGANDRDKDWFDIYKLKLSTGEKTPVRKNTDRIFAWKFDSDGRLRMAGRDADNGDRELLRVDQNGFTKVYSCKVTENCWPYRFRKDGKRVYLWTSKGERAQIELVLLDLDRGESAGTELVASDPLKRAGPGNFIFSDVKNELQAAAYRDDRQRYYFIDKQLEADFRWLESKLPGEEIELGAHTNDEQVWMVTASADTEPGATYLFDRSSRKLTFQYRVLGDLPRTALAEMKPVHYPSSDGLDIPAFLTLPKGVPSKALPLVIMPHGGPWARVTWEYDAWTQFFANRGYAVLQPNFRGSEGFGKAFKNAGDRERGRKMQDDLTWGVKYLIAQGIADPKRIGIFGISYGGYATLAGVTFTPDLYAAAVDYNGTSNLVHLVQSQPATSAKEYFERVGDPTAEEGRAILKERSPALHADKIKTPLMIVQGANDSSVQRSDAEQIVVSLRDRAVPVEYLLAPDEGHVFVKPVNNMAMFMAVEKFFSKYLGGRYQEDATPEVAARLAAINVDPKTVSGEHMPSQVTKDDNTSKPK